MQLWLIHNGISEESAEAMEEHELLARSIVFSQFANGNLEWDWDKLKFVEKV